jgi:hypothetical protein
MSIETITRDERSPLTGLSWNLRGERAIPEPGEVRAMATSDYPGRP